MSCIAKNGSNGECCSSDNWIGPNCTDGSVPNWNDAVCNNSSPCCPIGACPGDPSPPIKGCENFCNINSNDINKLNLNNNNNTTINSISIKANSLFINYNEKKPPIEGKINPWPMSYGSNVMWLYGCPAVQGLACIPKQFQTSNGGVSNDFITEILNRNINYISLISNNKLNTPSDLGVELPTGEKYPSGFDPTPSKSGQHQTNIIFSKSQLKTLHDNGITIVLSIGSWLTDFVRNKNDIWTQNDYINYVERFKCIRCSLGNTIDGIDFDIEGSCESKCLASGCECGWDDNCSGDGWTETNNMLTKTGNKCYSLPTQTTIDVMNGISNEMKKNNFVVSIVPPTNTLFSSEKSTYNGQNQLVKYGLNFNNIDGIMFQFYTGFDAGICKKGDDRWGNCLQQNETNLYNINLDYLVNNGIDNSYKNLPTYSNYPNRSPLHCPRYIDCPDWKYKGEKPFQRQVEYFNNLVSGVEGITFNKIVLGLEFFFNTSQWGPFPSPSLFYGLNNALKNSIHKNELAGVGGWTIAGTFGDFNYPNTIKNTIGLETCNREGYNKGSSDIKSKIEGNMWCISPYHEHFEKNISSCWGTWGKNKSINGIINLKKAENICSELKPQEYCIYENNDNGLIQCNTNSQYLYPNIPSDWPPQNIEQ